MKSLDFLVDEFQIKEILALIVMHQKMKMPFQLMDENASEGEMVGDVCDVNKADDADLFSCEPFGLKLTRHWIRVKCL